MRIESSQYQSITYLKDLPAVPLSEAAKTDPALAWYYKTTLAEPIADASRQRDRLGDQLDMYARLSAHADTLDSDAKELLAARHPSNEDMLTASQWQSAAKSMRADIAKANVGQLYAQRDALIQKIDSYRGTTAMDAFNYLYNSAGYMKDSFNV